MRKVVLCFWMACSLTLSAGSRADFSGKWTFDRMEAENPPQSLDSYTMSVTQSDHEVTVHSRIEGDATVARRKVSGVPMGSSPEDMMTRGGGTGGRIGEVGEVTKVNSPNDVRVSPARGPVGPPWVLSIPPPSPPKGGSLSALATVVPSATYTLDERETIANVGGQFPGGAKLRTKWKNDGTVLELSMLQMTTAGKQIATTERWELEDGGRVLRVERSIEGARGKNKLKLTFKRLASAE